MVDFRYYTNNESIEISYPEHPSIKFKFDKLLFYRLLSIAHDSNNDFSFIILISGDGMVRVGKSVLAQQACYILGMETGIGFDFQNLSTLVFNGDDLIKIATECGLRGERKVFWYDEARADLNSKQVMTSLSQTIGNFIAETGKFNHVLVLVLPDFFELQKRYALNYSECLINCKLNKRMVKHKSKLGLELDISTRERGVFSFFTRNRKKSLYIRGMEYYNYNIAPPTFKGRFLNYWIINRALYESKKDEFLKRDRNKKVENSRDKKNNEIIMALSESMGFDKAGEVLNKANLLTKQAFYKRKLRAKHDVDRNIIVINPETDRIPETDFPETD